MTQAQLAKRAVWKAFAQLNQAKAAAFEAFANDEWQDALSHLWHVQANAQDTIDKIKAWAAIGAPTCELTMPVKDE